MPCPLTISDNTEMAKLTKAFIEQAADGVYTDPGTPGLCLRVRCNGAYRSWIFRRMVQGKRRDVGLGNADDVTLSKARVSALNLRSMTDTEFAAHIEAKRNSKNTPKTPKEDKPAACWITFQEAAERFMLWNVKVGNWEDWGKTHRVFESRMRLHVFPFIGNLPLNEITPSLIAKFVEEIWDQIDLLDRCLGFTKSVFDWCTAHGLYQGANPADRHGALKYILPKRTYVKQHRGALSVEELPDFFAELMRPPLSPSRALFAFSILTATRSLTARAATWDQFDFEEKTWTIPPQNLKVSENGALVVPLAPKLIEFLENWGIKEDGYLFSPTKVNVKGAMYSDAVFSTTMKDLSEAKLLREKTQKVKNPKGWIDKAESLKRGREVRATQHGIARATFRTWSQDDALGNDKRFDARTAELCLHHKVNDAYNGAYERNESFIRRREMMEAWADYCFSKVPHSSDTSEPQAND